MPAGARPHVTEDPAFAAMLQRATPTLRGFVRRLAASDADADDVLQETLTKVWRLRASFDPNHDGEAWLRQAAFRTFCDHRRRRQRQCTRSFEQEPTAPAVPCDAELRDEVQRRLRDLPTVERELLLGFHRDGLSLNELAVRHALPVNTVKSHLHRARRRLQEPHDAT